MVEATLTHVLHTLQDCALAIADARGVVTAWGVGAASLTGYSEAEAVGAKVDILLWRQSDLSPASFDAEFVRAEREGRAERIGWLRRRDGRRFYGACVLNSLRDDSGACVGYTVFLRDLTFDRRASEEIRVLTRLAEITDDFIAIADLDGKHTFVNASGVQLVGAASEQELFDTPLVEMFVPEDRPRILSEVLPEVIRQGSWSGELRFRHLRTGESIPVRYYLFRVEDEETGQPTALATLTTDLRPFKERERQLEESESRYRALIDAVPQLVWSCLPNGECDYLSQQWEDYTGVAAAEQFGFRWAELLHPDDRGPVLEEWKHSIDTGAPFDIDYRLRGANGKYRWFRTQARPLAGADGKTRRWFGTCTDIHDRKLAEQALELANEVGATLAAELDVERIVQAVTDASTVATEAQFGAFFYNVTNADGESYMLYTLSGVPRDAFSKFPMPRNTPVFAPTFEGEGVVRSDDITKDPRYGSMAPHYGMPEGHLPVCSYLAVPVVSRSGEVIGGLFFGHTEPARFTEVHERTVSSFASQAAVALDNAGLVSRLRGLNEELEQRVEERTAHLLAAVQELEGFTYSVSHDMRAPLRGIISNAHMLMEDERERVSDDGFDHLRRLVNAATKMAALVDDLLRFARLGRDDVRREVVDMAMLGQQVADSVLENATNATIRVTVPPGTRAHCDPRMVGVALQNLLENSCKYRAPGVPADVEFGADETGFFVRDRGIGFDMIYADRIFEPFQRLHRDAEYPGTGIGLANVRRIIVRHDGRVWAESAPGQGATFRFTLG
jgi:PAS domain S-box-containing protein